jgi:hypothetical protein
MFSREEWDIRWGSKTVLNKKSGRLYHIYRNENNTVSISGGWPKGVKLFPFNQLANKPEDNWYFIPTELI